MTSNIQLYQGDCLEVMKNIPDKSVDPDYGYTFDNVAPCCSKCNFAKHSMQEIEFFEWVQKVYEHIFNTTTTTTGVAAKNLNRNFIGIEKDEGYFKIAKERIEKA